ncbi:alcohol dehydrogenase 1-like [Pectinophora gossypiella]|uniref:alcohol dehydrogenase 1-like n=1 Tax=Pectinophora gossypiella TaxID=13191 RepID=UPI00214E0112|nr:alcohol dehydrogenase 1-like [Pectinophora gossypiella]
MYDAKEKVVLITGGAAGIGAGVVKAFLEEGAKHVAILDVDPKGKTFEEELNAKYGANTVKFYKCDVTSNDLHEAYDDVIKSNGYIDIVVNCAGILNDGPNGYEKQIAVNLTALITSSLKAYNLMRKDHGGKGGTIINISSIVGLVQSKIFPIYGATKSAVLQFSNGLGMNLHYDRSAVRVLTMCFGCTDTTLFDHSKMKAIDKETDEALALGLKSLPWQAPESAVKGLMDAFKKGESGSTWLASANKPAYDISANISKAYEIMSQGVYDK